MKKVFLILLFIIYIYPFTAVAQEQSIILDPYIIDEKVKARDILEYTIKIKNASDRKLALYAVINDVTPEGGRLEFGEPEKLDKTISVARWIEFSRSVIEIEPKKEASIPLRIKISMYAVPGKRYASISFAEGLNRYDAEAIAAKVSLPKVMINLDINEELVEKAELTKFGTDQTLMFQQPVNLLMETKNIGNAEIQPIGEIKIYDRRGVEVGNININKDGKTVKPNDTYSFKEPWFDKKGFGKYKAKLEIEYGDKATRDLQDVIYFWILPWQFIAGFAFLVLLLFIVLAIASRKKEPRNTRTQIAIAGSNRSMDVIINKK